MPVTRALGRARVSGRRGLVARWLDAVLLARQRRQLAALDDHLLRDIGLDAGAARREAARPVWDAPSHWHD